MPAMKRPDAPAHGHVHHHGKSRGDKPGLARRLNRIEGQVRGLNKMVEEERYCVDILTQIAAVRSALDAVALQLLRDHAHGCVQDAVRSGRGDPAIDELLTVVEKFAR